METLGTRQNFSQTFHFSKKTFRRIFAEFESRYRELNKKDRKYYPIKDMPKFLQVWNAYKADNYTISLSPKIRTEMDCVFFIGLDDDSFLETYISGKNKVKP